MNGVVRREAELLLDRDEEISGPMFAGAMARRCALGLDEALDLHDELTGTETPREDDDDTNEDNTQDDERPVLEEAMAVTGGGGSGGSSREFAEHFERVADVYAELGTIGELRSIGNYDFAGWYNTRETDDESNWTAEGRAFNLAEEYDAIHERLDRTLYATINYVDREWFDGKWTGYNWIEDDDGDSNRVWDGGKENKPTPGYEDIRAYAPFADIDLADAVKYDRPDGEIPKGAVEDAIERYIGAFAELAGGREHVYALDSVGGAYVMVAPTSTAPIAEAFDDPDERATIYTELAKRANEWLLETREEINAAVPAVKGTFEPDDLNNNNRLYKAPMAVHKDLDGVVTPIDTEAVAYDYTPAEAVDDALIDESTEWAAGFTSDHSEAVAGVVRALWSDYAEADGWVDVLRTWLDEKQAEAEERRRGLEEIAERRRERLDALGTSVSGQSITPHVQDVLDAVDAVDIRQLAKSHCREWEPTGRADHFNPGRRLWKESDSGTSCFVNTSKNIFVDIGENGGKGGPAKFMALKEDAIATPDQDASGEPFWTGVEALRADGYDIPVYVPERGSKKGDGSAYEKTPLWALRKAAVALRVLPRDAFVTRESDDGGTYEGFPGRETFDRTLDELEALGVDHGRERNRSTNTLPTRVEAGLEKDPENDEEAVVQAFTEMLRGA